ncbi:agmatine deiminase family protein [Marinobacter fonticola]|uniref:agmatine deiminase family protein n=1 Tax=Marinobacter fonticola TaxID=2603215 RepID=UPI0011E7ABB3|nr:agmatine deiminase family protein [Marinobacter fonticola]
MPAEWAPQSAVMLTWPHGGTDWLDSLGDVERVFETIARAVLRFEHLLLSCEDASRLTTLTASLNQWADNGGYPGRVYSVNAPANDTWARDHGPIAIDAAGQTELLDFRFNAWGDKFAWDKDDALNRHLHEAGAFGSTQLTTVDLVLEGGSIESDGMGTILTTSECLLATTRNPGFDRAEIESKLKETLGAERVLWLNHGYLAGDDTDSHIDTLARFCAPDHICYVRCNDEGDEHYAALRAMEAELEQFRRADDTPYRLTALPWPDPCYGEEGERLPATYANFLIINGAVLFPVYDVPQDDEAVRIAGTLFPDREIVPIDCRPLIHQHGSLHCVTMQLPTGVVNP